jgi:hypothetical protein
MLEEMSAARVAPDEATDHHDSSVMLAGNEHRGWRICDCRNLSSWDPSEPPRPLRRDRRPP